MKTYIVKHYWGGASEEPTVYFVSCEHFPSTEEVITACDIDFDDGETIDIEEIEVVSI